jgi:hypothetical protein
MNVKAIMTVGCLCLALGLCGTTTWAQKPFIGSTPIVHAPNGHVVSKVKTPPKIYGLPALTIIRIFIPQQSREIAVEMKNNGGPISSREYQDIKMLYQINSEPANIKLLERLARHALAKPGRTKKVYLPIPHNLTCDSTIRVNVQVDIPLERHGIIRESNELNNEMTIPVYWSCP